MTRQALPRNLRGDLERTVIKARTVAEAAVRHELGRLGVLVPSAPDYLQEPEKALRRDLRIHARQIGALQNIDPLVEETAYEHWHRMLFARFLVENSLLIHPEYGVPVSLDELNHEGQKQGISPWQIAGLWACTMLPQIFRPNHPAFGLRLDENARQDLEQLLAVLPQAVFLADDSMGWVYQFWQSEAKDKVNASETKIGAKELPAVTQLFTEDYMVSFLLDNSLGAWWAGKTLTLADLADDGIKTEADLRKKAALPGMPLEYLRFVQEEGTWRPAASTFPAWPSRAAELKYLDPCCGSGHFLVAGLRYLTAMRMAEEGLDARAAGDAVLRDNLHGLELDPRCVEIGAFSLALEAWKSGGWRDLPELHVACSGLAPRTSKQEWLAVADQAAGRIAGDTAELIPDPNKASLWKSELHEGMEALYELFKDAPVLGSLIDPHSVTGNLFRAGFDRTADLLASALKKERTLNETSETGVAAQGIAKAAGLLAGRYHLVATNVPYLARGKQEERLRDYCADKYEEAKNDLATVFLDRCLDLCKSGGSASIVLPQNWLFLTSYRKFREKLLKRDLWNIVARLGPKAFQTPMWDFNVQLITISAGADRRRERMDPVTDTAWCFPGIDAAAPKEPAEKAGILRAGELALVGQVGQLGNPDARIVLDSDSIGSRLELSASNHQGLSTGDNPRFRIQHWEVHQVRTKWDYEQSTVEAILEYGGRTGLLLWENGNGQLKKFGQENVASLHNVDSRGKDAWGKKGIAVSQMSQLLCSIFFGNKFDTNVAVLIPLNQNHFPAIWCFCSSPQYNKEVRKIDQSLKVTNATLVQVPFDLGHWTKVAQERYPNGLPAPFSDDPTQWIFHGHPAASVLWSDTEKRLVSGPLRIDATVLQVAVARLLGYRWPAELDPAMELSAESRALVDSCAAFLPFADDDGIVCIPAVRGERSAAERLQALLRVAYGGSIDEDALLAASDATGSTIKAWLREKFFEQHCKLFHHRPFIWQIWDGDPQGFSVLVNYHKLTASTLEKLTWTYLGDWINQQDAEAKRNVAGAETRLVRARGLQDKLKLILKGEAPYDIFVRWKPLHEQPLGWNPDLNDGVRLNIRPFMTAGILRHCKKPKLNISWDKDRGKDVESAPWFHQFHGERINDWHTSLDQKQAARDQHAHQK